MLARTIVIAAMAALAYYLYRRWITAKDIAKPAPFRPQAMRKCAHCGLHLPEKEAIYANHLYFCSEEHKSLYLQEHP